jgi:hypothetical protein
MPGLFTSSATVSDSPGTMMSLNDAADAGAVITASVKPMKTRERRMVIMIASSPTRIELKRSLYCIAAAPKACRTRFAVRDATRFWFVTLADDVQQDCDRITDASNARASRSNVRAWSTSARKTVGAAQRAGSCRTVCGRRRLAVARDAAFDLVKSGTPRWCWSCTIAINDGPVKRPRVSLFDASLQTASCRWPARLCASAATHPSAFSRAAMGGKRHEVITAEFDDSSLPSKESCTRDLDEGSDYAPQYP